MSSLLFALWDGGGSVDPLLAVMRGARARGHEVRVLGSASLGARIAGAGFAFAPFAHAPEHDSASAEHDIVRDWATRSPLTVLRRARDELLCGPAASLARDVVEEIDRAGADALAIDLFLFGAMAGAEARGVPWATMAPLIYPFPLPGRPPGGVGIRPARGPIGRARDRALTVLGTAALDSGRRTFNAARAGLGLPAITHVIDQPLRAGRVLVLSSTAFDTTATGLPENVRYVGFPSEPPVAEPWAWPGQGTGTEADAARPLVLVSLSTTYQAQRPVLERLIAALAGVPARVLVTLGPAFAEESFAAPPNVVVRRFVDHGAVLGQARLVVTHAGHGTVMRALAAGVPLVCLPMGRDQHDNAQRVVAAGAGLRLDAGAPSGRLRAAIVAAIEDESLLAGARRMAARLAEEDGVGAAVDELEALATARAGPRRPGRA